MFYIIIFYIFMFSKTFYTSHTSTTNNSIQSSWEDLGQIEEFQNTDKTEVKNIENQRKKLISSEKLISEIRDIYYEYNDVFHIKLNAKNDDDNEDNSFKYKFLSEKAKLSFLAEKIQKAEKNLQILLNIFNSPKNIVISPEAPEKENLDSINNNLDLIREDTLHHILIRAEQINCNIFTRYKETIFQYRSSKSSLSASPNTNKNNLFCEKSDNSSLSTSPNTNKNNLFCEKQDNRYKAQVTVYLTSSESTPQENCFNTNSFIPLPKKKKSCANLRLKRNKTSYPNLPPERNKTAVFKDSQPKTPYLDSLCLPCEFITEKIILLKQTETLDDDSSDEK